MAVSSSDRPRTLNDLLSNKNFIELEQITRRPNIFEALNIAEYEVRHSTFLSYLLDPNETHGLGTGFLESFLLRTSIYTDQNDLNIRELDLDMTRVTKEWSYSNQNFLDILLEIPKKNAEELIIGIECKINSSQGEGQLEGYRVMLHEYAKPRKSKVIHLFLTKFDEEAPHPWYEVRFEGLVTESLDITIKKYGLAISEKVLSFLNDYRDILGESGGYSEREVIAKSLAKDYGAVIREEGAKGYLAIKHKHAYEAIKQAIKDQDLEYLKVLREYLKDKNYLEGNHKNRNLKLRFYPSENYPADIECCTSYGKDEKSSEQKYPIEFEIELIAEKKENEVGVSVFKPHLFLYLAPLKNVSVEERKKLVDSLRVAIDLSDQKGRWTWKDGEIKPSEMRVIRSQNNGKDLINHDNAKSLIKQMVDQAKDAADVINLVIERSPMGKGCDKSVR